MEVRVTRRLAAVGLCVLLTGWVVLSVHSPFDDGERIFDEALLGPWVDDEENVYYFVEGADSSYEITVSTDEGSTEPAG